jgi:glucose-6-phosphate isomerase
MKISGKSLASIDRESEIYRRLQETHPRIAKKDAATWGAKASAEAAIRLNWVDLPELLLRYSPSFNPQQRSFQENLE